MDGNAPPEEMLVQGIGDVCPVWRGSDCWVWGSSVLSGGKGTEAGVSMGQGTAVGFSGKVASTGSLGCEIWLGKCCAGASGPGKCWDG